MVASAHAEQKRQGEALAGPSTKRAKTEEDQAEHFTSCCTKAYACFGEPQEEIKDLSSLAVFCFEKATLRLKSTAYVKTEEIIAIYKLFFEDAIKEISEEAVSTPVNPIVPHPAHVFKSLYECLSVFDAYPSFKDTVEASRQYIEKNGLRAYLQLDHVARQRILPHILEQNPDFQGKFDQCPLYTTQAYLGSKNIHAAYVLRDQNYQPKWIFKPTSEVHPDHGLLNLNVNDSPEHTIREKLAHLLNFHSEFPIPATFIVEMKGHVGSIQLFIEGEKQDLSKAEPELIIAIDLQKLLIFDLLFSNCDRHDDNFLVIMKNDRLRIFGIDHDSCLNFDNSNLKIDYLHFAHVFNKPFDPTLVHIVSEEFVERYQSILQDEDTDSRAIDWIIKTSQLLRESFEKKKNADITAKNLIELFNRENVE